MILGSGYMKQLHRTFLIKTSLETNSKLFHHYSKVQFPIDRYPKFRLDRSTNTDCIKYKAEVLFCII